jgi:photosystem II stability/assembly factor-like uncharacterized protein
MTLGVPAANLQSVYLLSSSDGWIVGCSTGGCGSGIGEPVSVHWNGTSFIRGDVSAASGDLYSVFMVSSSDGWAVGGVGSNPIILQFAAGTWTQIPITVSGAILHSVFMVDPHNGWTVGTMGTILQYYEGTWSAVPSPTTRTLRSVYMLSGSDGWAVGDGGELLRYQGSSGKWVRILSPTNAELNSVFLADSSHGWAVGIGGTILHYDGSLWHDASDSITVDLNSVVEVNPQEAWAVGDSATVLQWRGFSWHVVMPPSPLAGNPDLNSISMVSSSFGLIVGAPPTAGDQGTILQVPQINPIPEVREAQILLAIILIATFPLLSRIQKKKFSKP